jgi:AraC-like DNA-binding protein
VDIIAERVGYADVTHFIRLFRRVHGVTPAAWRRRATAVFEYAEAKPPDERVRT